MLYFGGIMNLKIGRHEYEISTKDVFMDNGACIQLCSQSKEKLNWSHRPSPVLSKRVIKKINQFDRLQHRHTYGDGVQIFSLKT